MVRGYSAEQWRVWFAEFKQSKLTVERFCKSIGVSVPSFYKWRRKLREDYAEEFTEDSAQSIHSFVPVTVTTSQLEVLFPGGVLVRVTNDKDSLRPLVELMLEIGAHQ